jgi:hypothetical protein
MAKPVLPENTYISQVINPGLDKRIPIGLVNVVFSRDGNMVGFVYSDQFYQLGTKVAKDIALKVETKLDINELNKNLPDGGINIKFVKDYVNSNNPELADAARKIITLQSLGIWNNEGKPKAATSETKDFGKIAVTQQQIDAEVERINKEAQARKDQDFSKKQAANAAAKKANNAIPYPDLAPSAGQAEKKDSVSGMKATAAGGTPGAEPRYTAGNYFTYQGPMSQGGVAQGNTVVGGATGGSTGGTGGGSSGSKGGGTGGGTTKTPSRKTPYSIDEIYSLVAQNYGPIDLIFKSNPELKELLLKSVGKDQIPGTSDDYTADQFTKMLENTSWFKSNATAIRQRGFYKRQYEELRKTTDNVAGLDQTSEYGRGLTATKQKISDAARSSGVVLDAATLDLVARDVYDLGYENTPAIIQQQIRSRLKYSSGQALGGAAGQSLAALKSTAAANGLDLDKNFGTQIQTWLQNIDQGESVETYKQIIRGTAKLGLPDKVGSLLDLGVDLDTVYQPYKNIMYQVLEISPETINVNDATLRKAIGPDKEMSLYEWQDYLKKDPRWQYTNNAKDAAYSGAETVLKDFGMIG